MQMRCPKKIADQVHKQMDKDEHQHYQPMGNDDKEDELHAMKFTADPLPVFHNDGAICWQGVASRSIYTGEGYVAKQLKLSPPEKPRLGLILVQRAATRAANSSAAPETPPMRTSERLPHCRHSARKHHDAT